MITGGCGFLGANLAEEILKDENNELHIFDNLRKSSSNINLDWLRSKGKFKFHQADIRKKEDVEQVVKSCQPDVIFHFASQVAMTVSIADPRLDFEINALGTFNLADAVRQHSPHSIIIFSSTNKVYGDLEWVKYRETLSRYEAPDFPNGFPENIQIDFQSPYGCSKGYADQFLLDSYRVFGTKTVVFRHSSMFGPRQFSTYDQGWIGWFCEKALEIKKGKLKEVFTISGNGKQVRDVLFADDMKRLYMAAIDNIDKAQGQAFNIGGGMQNSLSLIELFDILEKELNIKMNHTKIPARQSDQKVFVADISKANKLLGWSPKTDKISGLKKMISWVEKYE